MTTGPTMSLELTGDELRILRGALESFISDFGHDEADVIRLVRGVLAKVDALQPSEQANAQS